ncbi:MAG: penicillin acylase family protein, partial [Bdellovibrio sp.]|nr:penicillin acylase family protein [Bdellovibrio sp.]
MRKLKKILLGVLIILLLCGVGVYIFLRQPIAPMDGTHRLTNVSAPVTIQRDAYGIPHIFAKTKIDAMRALGYITASERLFQMEMSRRLTQGELSEVVGDKALKTDMLYRSLMLKKSSQRMLNLKQAKGLIDSKMWAEMEAFTDGINQYMAERPLPYELVILGIKPRPFTPLDSYIMTGQMAYSFGIALKADTTMTEIAKKLTPDLFQQLRNDRLSTPITLASNSPDLSPLWNLPEFMPSFDSSNSWLISPRRSASGKAIFANDPHISFGNPAVWFEAHIKTPEFELYGHYLPLVPFAVLGHNRHHAWGFTMSQTDDMDLYRETIDRDKKTVLFKGKSQPYDTWTETIKVRGHRDVSIEVIETPHGPLMNSVLDQKDLALKWAFHRVENDPLLALYKMGEAKDIKEFEIALKDGSAPGLNVMYADPQNIAWWMFGDIAVKKNPNSDLILNGATGADEYERLLSWDEKPHEVNP